MKQVFEGSGKMKFSLFILKAAAQKVLIVSSANGTPVTQPEWQLYLQSPEFEIVLGGIADKTLRYGMRHTVFVKYPEFDR